MINGNIINGNIVNGISSQSASLSPEDNISIYENLSFSKLINASESDTVNVHENVKFLFNKGMNKSESIGISENLDIVIGDLILHIEDEPVHISESLSFDLQKEVLMQDQIQYYLDLLILQYRNKPKAIAHVGAIVKQALIDLMPSILQNAFSIESAEGPQLDQVGKYIGIPRRVKTFSSDVTLSDVDYRSLLNIKRMSNNLGSSFYDIQNFININLEGTLKAFDHKDMTMSFYLNSGIISKTVGQAIVMEKILPKPMGVSYASIVYIPVMTNIFGFRTYELDSGTQVGFNTYSSYHTERKLISYEDSLYV